MSPYLKNLYTIIFLLFPLINIVAQEPEDMRPEDSQQQQSQEENRQQADTTKLRISLRSLRPDMLSYDTVPFDTFLTNIHLNNQIKQKLTFFSHLGNRGLPMAASNYFERSSSMGDFNFLEPVSYNFIHQGDILYYKTNKPYSNISYNSSGAKSVDLQSIRFVHTQNVNEKLNVGTLLRLHGANGLYQRQKSTVNALSLFSGYNGEYYTMNAVVSYNTLKNQESGGLANDTIFEKDDEKGAVYPTVLTEASTNIKNTYIFLNQRFNIAGLRDLIDKKNTDSVRKFSGIGLLHTFELNRNKRNYLDPVGLSGTAPANFYRSYNIDETNTSDSLFFLRIKNSLELLLGKQNPNEPPILIRAGIKSLFDKYQYSILPDTLITVNQQGINDTSYVTKFNNRHYNNLAFTGGISVGIKSIFLLNATGDYYFSGYKAGDLYLHGKLSNRLSKKPGSLSFNILLDISRYKPGYFVDSYFSNHFQWNSNFIPVKEVKTGIEIKWPDIKFEGDFNYALLSSPVYFDSIATPAQFNGEVSVLEASASKGFKAGIFYSTFRTLLQITSNDRVIPLPLFSAFNSSYVELKLFNKVMTTQLGFDVRYNTAYYVNGYMPDLGIFYNQRLRQIGNYPYVNAFLNVKLKRMRFYLKFEHVNSDLLSRDYYTLLHYPANSRMLMYGLSWNFYD